MGCVSVSVVSSEHVIPFPSSPPIKLFLGGWPLLLSICKPRHSELIRSLSSKFSSETMAFSLASDPLFSTIITFCTLILLYLPTLFLRIVFSPILISTSGLLISLLRLGAVQRATREKEESESQEEKDSKTAEVINSAQKSAHDLIIDDHEWVSSDSSEEREKESKNAELNSTQQTTSDLIIDDYKWASSDFRESSESAPVSAAVPTQKAFYSDSFVEWDVRAPLEVIYEEYEGEEEDAEEHGDLSEGKREAQMTIIERYASLSKFYPETDSDISSEEDFLAIRNSPEYFSFQWEGEEKEELIEIELGQKRYSEVEEENLIEIDLYPASFPVS